MRPSTSAAEHPQPTRILVPAQRRELIAERLQAGGSVTVAELEREFGMSAMTARRDLQELERQGRARRTHGGAVVPQTTRKEDSFRSRLGQAADAKQRLGAAAAAHLVDGEAVFVDSSTSAYAAVQCLLVAGRRLTVLTNSIPVMDLVAQTDAPNVSLIGLSGSLRAATRSFVGPQTIDAIERHFADKLIFSVKAVTRGGTLTEADALEAEVKATMAARARESLLLVDGSKFEATGLNAITEVDAVGRVLVADTAREHITPLRRRGVTVEEVR
ncbi:MAG TPA: DeoR/GlpR family DNA-binding transcription regulator [Solirubrobacteraceae bacterium]|nr:DeoR/GlpR family DNA-binding transcription regulator [Solirubrobacteraceae bacterium]